MMATMKWYGESHTVDVSVYDGACGSRNAFFHCTCGWPTGLQLDAGTEALVAYEVELHLADAHGERMWQPR